MTVIELPDEQAAALKARAAAQGLTLEEWFEELASSHHAADKEKSLVEFFRASPLVGLELNFERSRDSARDIDR